MESHDRDAGKGETHVDPQLPIQTSTMGRLAGSQVVGTDDPAIDRGAPGKPDRTMAIETGRIQGPDDPSRPGVVTVPEEADRLRSRLAESESAKDQNGHPSAGGSSSEKTQPEPEEGKNERQVRSGKPNHGGTSRWSSMTQTFLVPAVVALVCGVAGAWTYSHFFGPSKPAERQSSGKGSESSKGGDSDKSSTSSQSGGSESSGSDEDKSKVSQVESAWLMAVKELHAAQASEKEARRSEDETKSILEFFKKTLLSAGRPVDASLSEAFWAGGPAKAVTLRKALDITESQVAEMFTQQPLAEATVREMLGLAYLTVGEPSLAVKQYERAFSLRQALQGANVAETAACRNQLAVAYRLAGRIVEGGRLFDRYPNSPAHAATLAVSGTLLLSQKNTVAAELKFRESLQVRQKVQPDEWTTFETQSLLGEALLDQHRFAEAEPLLKSGYEGMKERRQSIPPEDRLRLTKSLERLIRLYEAWGKEAEALQWRKDLNAAPL